MTVIHFYLEVDDELRQLVDPARLFLRVREHDTSDAVPTPDGPSGTTPYGRSADEGTYDRDESLDAAPNWWTDTSLGLGTVLEPATRDTLPGGGVLLKYVYTVAEEAIVDGDEEAPSVWDLHEALRERAEAEARKRERAHLRGSGLSAFVAMGNTAPSAEPSGEPHGGLDAVKVQRRLQTVCFEILDETYPVAHTRVPLPLEPVAGVPVEARLDLAEVLERPWELGTNTVAHIPRVVRHAMAQPYTPMINWEVDTLRTWVPGVGSGRVRSSFGWDIVFGRAAQRGTAHARPFTFSPQPGNLVRVVFGMFRIPGHLMQPTSSPTSGLTALGSELRKYHNADKLASARNPNGWIPWVLAYAESVGIPFGRIVATVDHTGPVAFADLEEMQDNANASWLERGLLGGPTGRSARAPSSGPASAAVRWDLGDAALLDRLLNGMCPHDPAVVPVDPTQPDGPARLVWTFTWTGDGPLPRSGQDGIFDVDADADICENARMPDVRVESTPAEQSTDGTGPALRASVQVARIGLRFPGEAAYTWFTPQGPAGPVAPGPEAYTTGWAFAKWFVRQALLVAGQIDWHLARCHVYMEQMCAVLCTHLRRRPLDALAEGDHPLLRALWPFIRSADEINAFGDLTLLSAYGVLSQACCLDHPAAMQRLRRQRAAWRWWESPVRRAATPDDLFAQWSQAAWAACEAWALALPASTFEALGAGQRLGDRVRNGLADVQTAHVQGDPWQPWWGRAGDAPSGARPPLGAAATDGTYRLPETHADWRAFATHLLYAATFLHSWVGGRQFSDMGNAWVASAGHRWAKSPLGPGESWTAADARAEWKARGPLPAHAGFIVSLSELIGENDWGRFEHLEDEVEVEHQGDEATALRTTFRSTAAARAEAGTLSPTALERLPVDRVRTRICI